MCFEANTPSAYPSLPFVSPPSAPNVLYSSPHPTEYVLFGVLNLWRRYLRHCPHRMRTYKKCGCPIWVQGTLNGKWLKKSLDLRNWEAAQKLVCDWERGGAGSEDNLFRAPARHSREIWQKADSITRAARLASILGIAQVPVNGVQVGTGSKRVLAFRRQIVIIASFIRSLTDYIKAFRIQDFVVPLGSQRKGFTMCQGIPPLDDFLRGGK